MEILKFKNVTTRTDAQNAINWQKLEIKQTSDNVWNITDKFNNEWNLQILGEQRFKIYSVPHYSCDACFTIECVFNHNEIEIIFVECNGRKYKSEKYFKRFSQIACFMNSLYNYGYLTA